MVQEQRRWDVTLEARQSSLGTVADLIEEVCDTLDLDEDAAFAVRLAADEAFQNACEHACQYDPEKQVTLRCENIGSDLVITVREHGEPFDPAAAAPPKLDGPLTERNGGGMGIHFMRKMMDEVRYDRGADGANSVTMVKRGVVGQRSSEDVSESFRANATHPAAGASDEPRAKEDLPPQARNR
jgi:anti-sigma regulatory factor (Ser/Thr protein kinase)